MNLKIKAFFLSIINLFIAFFLFSSSQNYNWGLGLLEKIIIFSIAIFGIIGIVLIFISLIQKLFNKEDWFQHALEEWYSFKFTLDIFFILLLASRIFFIQPFLVEGESMFPTLHNGDYLIVEKFSYKIKEPQRGDIIVFNPPETQFSDSSKIYIKRIIGLPYETIEIKNGKVFIYNKKHPEGIELQEPYIEKNIPTLGWQKRSLGKDEYFVLGDNREPNKSSDSREWGPVLKNRIIGRAVLRLLPFESFTFFENPNYNLIFLFKKF